MIEGKWFAPGTDLSQPLALRRLILNQEADALDPMAWNVVVYREGQPAATGRIWWQDGAFWIGGIAVLPAYRRQQLGDLTLRLLLFKAQSHSARRIPHPVPGGVGSLFHPLGLPPRRRGQQRHAAPAAPGGRPLPGYLPGLSKGLPQPPLIYRAGFRLPLRQISASAAITATHRLITL